MSRFILILLVCFMATFAFSCGSSDDNKEDGDIEQNVNDGDEEPEESNPDGDTDPDMDMEPDLTDQDSEEMDSVVDGDISELEELDSTEAENTETTDTSTDGDDEIENEAESEEEEELEPEITVDCTCAVDEVNDDFEDGNLYGWKLSSVYEAEIDSTKGANGSSSSVKLTKTTTGSMGLYKTFDPITPCKISFYTYVDSCPDTATYQNFVTPLGYTNTMFKFSITGLYNVAFTDDADTYHKIADCAAQTWYHIEIYPDWENKTMDIYLDGSLVKTDFPFYRQATEYIDQLRFYHSANVTGYLDELEMYTDCNAPVDGDTDDETETPVYWSGDDFEDGNANDWQSTGSGFTVTVDNTTSALSSGHSMLLDQTGANPYGDYGPYYSFESYQPCEVSFWVWADTCPSTNTEYQNTVILSGKDIYSDYAEIFFFFIYESGLGIYTDHTIPTLLETCTDKTWYKVTYYLNWSNKTYTVYLNGQVKQTNLPFNGDAQFADKLRMYNLTLNSKGRIDEIELKKECN